MKIIIPGGSGMVGTLASAQLTAKGHRVIILSRDPQAAQRAGLPAGVEVRGWDAATAQGWGELNLVGENLGGGRWTPAQKKRILYSRKNAGKAIVQAVQQAQEKPGVVLQVSGVGYYGPSQGEIITESAPAGDDFPAQVCQAWEGSSQPVEALGVRRVVMRTGVVLSKRGGALKRMLLPFYFFVGGPLGDGKQWLSWIHEQDQIDLIEYFLENESSQGIYNVTSPQPVQNRDFARAIGKAMGRPAWMPAPAFAIRLLFGEMATVVLDGQRVVPDRLNAEGFKFRYAEPLAALRDILK
jgi:uncharacterized protein (TIGR01777 family)